MTQEEPRQEQPRPEGAGPDPSREPTEEELAAAFEEQLRQVRVQDVLVQTVVTLVNLAGRRLGLGAADAAVEKDLEQARLAIEGTRALLPLLPAEAAPIREALSQLQVAYAREAGAPAGPAPGAGARPEGTQPRGEPAPDRPATRAAEAPAADPGRPPPAEDAERERARSKIWTPPGS